MKKITVIFIALLILTSCEGLADLFQKKITISGKISSGSKVSANHVKSSANAFTLADATKVLAYYGNKYSLTTINKGSFSIQVPDGSATCLVFLTDNNQFIGNLFAGGLNVLPLVGLGSTTSIDLSTLSLEGTRVIPANDPIGSSIQISAKEVEFMQSVSAYYQTLSKNLDMDNDGSPDVVDGDQVRVNSIINMICGSFGTDSKPAVMLDTAQFALNYGLRLAGSKSMYDKDYAVSLIYNNDNSSIPLQWDPLKADPNLLNSAFQTEYILIFQRSQSSQTEGASPFKDGVYNFKLSSKHQYNFNFSNINMKNHMMMIKPTLHRDKDGYISKISYDFIFPDGSAANPHNLIQGYIRSQLVGANYSQLYQGHPLYGTFTADDNYDYYNETLTKKIKLADINTVNFAYIDILGNEYSFNWTLN